MIPVTTIALGRRSSSADSSPPAPHQEDASLRPRSLAHLECHSRPCALIEIEASSPIEQRRRRAGRASGAPRQVTMAIGCQCCCSLLLLLERSSFASSASVAVAHSLRFVATSREQPKVGPPEADATVIQSIQPRAGRASARIPKQWAQRLIELPIKPLLLVNLALDRRPAIRVFVCPFAPVCLWPSSICSVSRSTKPDGLGSCSLVVVWFWLLFLLGLGARSTMLQVSGRAQ